MLLSGAGNQSFRVGATAAAARGQKGGSGSEAAVARQQQQQQLYPHRAVRPAAAAVSGEQPGIRGRAGRVPAEASGG